MATIPMIAPNGQSGDVPQDQVQKAQAAGFKAAYEMVAPDGKSTGYIPEDRVADAQKANFRFANFSQNPKLEGTYPMWDTAGHRIGVPYSMVTPAQGEGYKFDTNPDSSGLTPEARFQKDRAADPNAPKPGLLDPRGGWSPGDLARGAVAAVKNMVVHPIDTLKASAQPIEDLMPDYTAPFHGGPLPGASTVEHGVKQAEDVEQNPAYTIGSVAGPALVTAGVAKGAPMLADVADAGVNGVRTALAGDVDAPIAGTDVTPAQRYTAMKAVGVQPNAAEATNSTPLNIAEKVNQNSLLAAPTYAKARAANLAALKNYTQDLLDSMSKADSEMGGWSVQKALLRQQAEALDEHNSLASDVLDGMSQLGPEEGGAAVQTGLRKAQAQLQNQAAEGFSELDKQTSGRLLPGKTLQAAAQAIYDANADYYKNHPELVPGNAWKIVKDLAGADTTPPFQARPMRFPEVHQLRSDLLEMVRTNPDIVKNQAGGWLQQLADAADRTMTSGAAGLSPKGVQVFRDANKAWADMKGMYDNPSHPFYQAVRTPTPSALVKGLGQSPEMVKALWQALGPEGMGPIQRGVAEKVLGTTGEGGYDFKNFQANWNKLPPPYRDALFTPAQIQQLEGLANRTATNPFYDTQNLLYKVANTQEPLTLARIIGQSPTMVRTMQQALGSEGMGPIQRAVAEKVLGTTKEGNFNFKNFQGQWNKLPQQYREALFTPEQIQHLEDVGSAGTVLNEDMNPSGSARLGQGIAEGAEGLRSLANLHELAGNAAYHAAQYGLGRLMNSPRFVDWLMRGRGFQPIADGMPAPQEAAPAPGRLIPAAVTGGLLPSAWDWNKNQWKDQ